jgi:hypothetical protein
MLERRALQVSIAIAALLPVVGGLWGIVQDTPGSAWAGNHHRYLSGLLLAIGLGYWSTLQNIETMGARMKLLTGLVVIGGLARLLGVALGDATTVRVIVALAMELVVAPLLCLWHAHVTSRQDLPGIAKLEPHLRHMIP